jgi:hypothetical protein
MTAAIHRGHPGDRMRETVIQLFGGRIALTTGDTMGE